MFDQQPIILPQINQVLDTLARGTAWILVGAQVRSLMEPYTKSGIKADMRSMGNGPDVSLMTAGGYNRRPHPNATRGFVNWLLGREVQRDLAIAMEQASRRQDLTPATPPDTIPVKGAIDITPQRENMVDYTEDTTTCLINSWRKEGRGN